MITDKLYLEAEESGITVLCGAELPLTKSLSAELPDGEMFIGIDDSAMSTRAEERVHLAHELGHCVTGSPSMRRVWVEILDIPIKNIAEYVGHADNKMINRVYGHVMAYRRDEAADKLQDYFSKRISNLP